MKIEVQPDKSPVLAIPVYRIRDETPRKPRWELIAVVVSVLMLLAGLASGIIPIPS